MGEPRAFPDVQTAPKDIMFQSYRKVCVGEPETTSIFDIEPDAALEARLDAEAEAEIDAGKGVSHERVREWLAKLGNGEKCLPPKV